MSEGHRVKLFVDCSGDLPKALAEKRGIEIIPLIVSLGDKEYSDGVDIFPGDIYSYYKKTGNLPTTAAISPSTYTSFYEKWLNEGFEIVHLTISSELSAGYSNAFKAAQSLNGVYVIDSRNLSSGIAILALEGQDMIDNGFTAQETAAKLEALTADVNCSFVVNKLLFLWKGGRCTGIEAFGANLLNLKPCLELTDGKILVGKKYKGKLLPTLEKYVSERLASDDVSGKRIFITNSGEFEDTELDQVKAKVLSMRKFDEIIMNSAGATISSHCGPRTLGIIYMEHKRK